MRCWVTFLCGLVVLTVPLMLGQASAQTSELRFPETVEAGAAFSVATSGSGHATLYIAGPGDAIRREIKLGENISFGPDDLHNAGHYVAFLVAGSSTQNAQFEVVASRQPATLSFLAKPSRLPVNLPNGLGGVAYAFDVFRNRGDVPWIVFVVRGERPSHGAILYCSRSQCLSSCRIQQGVPSPVPRPPATESRG